MTPPLTGFFMKAVGLGDAHKQIEAEKRASEREADRRDFNRRQMHKLEEERHLRHLADVYDGSRGTGRGTAHGGQHSTRRSTLDSRRGSPELPRVHRDEISQDTLAEYELPWHWDRKDKNYIIIEIPFSERKLEEFRRHTLRNREPMELSKSAVRSQGSSPLPRVHRDDISQDTLAEYELPWHWDKKNKNYIIIEIPFSDRKLEEFRRHTLRNREHLGLKESAVRGNEEVEKIKEWRKNVEQIQEQWEPERRHGRDPEQGSMRGHRDHDRGRGRVPESGAHMNTRQADYVRPAPKIPSSAQKFSKGPSLVPQKPDAIEQPAPKMRSSLLQVQEVPLNPRHRSQSSAGAGLHSRSTRPLLCEEHTLTGQSHRVSRQPHRSQHRARHSQAPIEHLPSRSTSIARRGYGKPAAENTRQLPLRSARGSVQLGRERVPSSVRGLEPRRGFASMAGSLFEDGGEGGRRRGGTKRFA